MYKKYIRNYYVGQNYMLLAYHNDFLEHLNAIEIEYLSQLVSVGAPPITVSLCLLIGGLSIGFKIFIN